MKSEDAVSRLLSVRRSLQVRTRLLVWCHPIRKGPENSDQHITADENSAIWPASFDERRSLNFSGRKFCGVNTDASPLIFVCAICPIERAALRRRNSTSSRGRVLRIDNQGVQRRDVPISPRANGGCGSHLKYACPIA